MNKKLMVGALAVALIGGGLAGSSLLSTTHAATAPSSQAQQGNDKEVQDDAVTGQASASNEAPDKEVKDNAAQGADKEEADDQQGADKEVNDDQQGQDQETNDHAAQAPAGK